MTIVRKLLKKMQPQTQHKRTIVYYAIEAILKNIWYGLVLYSNYSVYKQAVNITVNMLKTFEDSIQTVKVC